MKYLAIIFLVFSFYSWTKADDIRDFQIEGMSIGDSLLNFYTEEKLNQKFFDYPNSDEFKRFYSEDNHFLQYEGVQVNYKKDDEIYYLFISWRDKI